MISSYCGCVWECGKTINSKTIKQQKRYPSTSGCLRGVSNNKGEVGCMFSHGLDTLDVRRRVLTQQ